MMGRVSSWVKKHMDVMVATLVVGIIMAFVASQFDYYYELNDDVLIKDILAGEYTGVPEGHNIQLLWPLSAIISLFYKIARPVPWYGLFLCTMHYLCFGLILQRSLSIAKTWKAKILVAVLTTALIISLFLEHLVFAHYSITAALMAATAAYLFYTLPDGLDAKQFVKKSLPSVLLIFVACCLRPNMMLLLLPLVGITGFIRWSREEKPLEQKNLIRYFSVIGLILGVVAFSFGTDKIAYSSPEWSRFETLFANRTELYDFQVVPDYEEHEAFYQEIGLKESEQALLVNYNYGLDQDITEITIGQVAQYAKGMKDARMGERVKEAVWNYTHRFFQEVDYPWNILVILLYVVLFFTILMRKNGKFLMNLWVAVWRLGLLFFGRTVLWMYILVNGRCPTRISHSLYLMEMCILLAILVVEYTRKLRDKNFVIMLTCCVLLGALIMMIPYRMQEVRKLVSNQEKVNVYGKALDEYCAGRPDRFYYVDVYSTIIDGASFADKMFVDVDNSYVNHDLLGGWSCNSPLYRKKQHAMGLVGPFEDLIGAQNTKCYLICKLSSDLDWLTNYYQDRGYDISIQEVDQIEQFYGVYKLEAGMK